jgi:hypothetical protein
MIGALVSGATGTLPSEVFAISNTPAARRNPIAWLRKILINRSPQFSV